MSFLFASFLFIRLSLQTSYVTIDPTDGTDTEDCLNGTISCKTIGYTFDNANNDTEIELLADTYATEMGGIMLNRSTITLSGKGMTSIITGSDTDPQTTFYLSEVDNLVFQNFLVVSEGDGLVTMAVATNVTFDSIMFLQESLASDMDFMTAYILFNCVNVSIVFSYDISVASDVCIFSFVSPSFYFRLNLKTII